MHQSPAMTIGTCPFAGAPHGQRLDEPGSCSPAPTRTENASNPAGFGFVRSFVRTELAFVRTRKDARPAAFPAL